jgi:hypothetical protein
MHQSEWNELAQCSECGAELSPNVDRGFAFAEQSVLCFDCAVRRGAQWDALHERWSRDPDLTGLTPAEHPRL